MTPLLELEGVGAFIEKDIACRCLYIYCLVVLYHVWVCVLFRSGMANGSSDLLLTFNMQDSHPVFSMFN